VAAALAAGVIAVTTADLPYKLGLMLAAIIGIVIGLALEARQAAKNDQRVRAS
jgi:uncharacterized integral membrane protein